MYVCVFYLVIWSFYIVRCQPYGVASHMSILHRLRILLARTVVYMYLLWLAVSSDQAHTHAQVGAHFSSFGHPMQVNTSCSQFCFLWFVCQDCTELTQILGVGCRSKLCLQYVQVHVATHCKSVKKLANLQWLVTPFGPGLRGQGDSMRSLSSTLLRHCICSSLQEMQYCWLYLQSLVMIKKNLTEVAWLCTIFCKLSSALSLCFVYLEYYGT